ncbi:MAG: WXG100 family type VII secretion target [Dermatophilaceae bacterium]
MIALLGDVEEMRRAAGLLQQRGGGLDAHADEVSRAAAQLGAAWSGAASMAFGGAAAGVRRGAVTAAGELRALAEASMRYADRLEDAQTQLGALTRREARALQPSLGPVASPGLGVDLDQAVARGRDDVRACLAAAQAVADEHRRATQDLARALGDSDPAAAIPAALADVAGAWELRGIAKDGVQVLSQGLATATLWRSAATLGAIQRVAGSAPLLEGGRMAASAAAAHGRAAAALQQLHGGPFRPGAIGAARTVVGKVGLGATLVGGTSDLVRGDREHLGVRSVATRVMGGVGAAGSGVLLAQGAGLVVAGGPVTLAIAGTAVTAYGVWKVGTSIYDHRQALARAATASVGRGAEAARAAGRRLERAKDDAGRRLGDSVRAAGDAVRGVGERLDEARGSFTRPVAMPS